MTQIMAKSNRAHAPKKPKRYPPCSFPSDSSTSASSGCEEEQASQLQEHNDDGVEVPGAKPVKMNASSAGAAHEASPAMIDEYN